MMQIAESAPTSGPPTVIGPSLALELSWAAHSAWSPRLRGQHRVLAQLADDDPELLREVREFWDDGLHCLAELEVLAFLAGALGEVEAEPLLTVLDSARLDVPPDLALRSESPADRAVIQARLDRLRTDDRRWHDYRSLLSALYAPLDGWWRTVGRPGAERAVTATRRALARGDEWRRMVSSDCVEVNRHIAEELDVQIPIVLVPCSLFGKGLYLDLPDCQLIGIGVELGEFGARARTGDLAKAMKVLADPTRLAILDHLRSGDRSIGELALDFDLSQPTVSVHVRQLRQAGLVRATRRGPRLELTVERDAVAALGRRLVAMVES